MQYCEHEKVGDSFINQYWSLIPDLAQGKTRGKYRKTGFASFMTATGNRKFGIALGVCIKTGNLVNAANHAMISTEGIIEQMTEIYKRPMSVEK